MTRFLAALALLALLALAVWKPVIAVLWFSLAIAVCVPLGRRLAAINSAERRNARRAYPGIYLPRLAGGDNCQEPSPAFQFNSAARLVATKKRGGQAGLREQAWSPAAFSRSDRGGNSVQHAVDDLADGISELPLAKPGARLRFGSGFGLSLHAEQYSGERKAWPATSQSTRRHK